LRFMKTTKLLSLLVSLILFMQATAFSQTFAQRMAKNLARSGDDLNIPSFLDQGKENNQHKKSKFLALGLSLALPGAGQYYTESRTKMIVFGSAEALIWAGFFGIRTYGHWKKNDYRAWAAFHAGANVSGKSETYFEKLTYYDNLDEYNQMAPLYDGSSAQLFPANAQYYWNWDSRANRDHYRSLRNQSKNAFHRSLFFVGAAIINRLLAGIDAYRAASAFDHNQEFSLYGWNLYSSTLDYQQNGGVEIGVTKRF
jgi:hypothetical protein